MIQLNMYELMLKYCPEFNNLNESIIVSHKNPHNAIGYNVVAVDKNGAPLGGGTASTIATARKIATVEALEKSAIKKLNESQRNEFKIDTHPTTCGVACGFDRELTMYRAMAEAVERWAWSKWIDENYYLEKIEPDQKNFSSLAYYFLEKFEKVEFYRKEFQLKVEDGSILSLQWIVSLAFNDKGVFPGSRICTLNEDPFEHALIESWRHLHIFKSSAFVPYNEDVIFKRILYFANNSNIAMNIIAANDQLKKSNWPAPEFILKKELEEVPFSLWRFLCDDYIGWHVSDEKRFVY